MATRIPAGLTAAEGRRFGLTVGAAFLVLTAFLVWRSHLKTAAVFGAIGTLLVIAGLAVPTRLGPVERGWMKFAHLISKVTTPIVMGVMYLLVLTPFGFLRRVFGGNPLEHAPDAGGYWKQRPAGRGRSNLTRQF
jgi:hypothetical protein